MKVTCEAVGGRITRRLDFPLDFLYKEESCGFTLTPYGEGNSKFLITHSVNFAITHGFWKCGESFMYFAIEVASH